MLLQGGNPMMPRMLDTWVRGVRGRRTRRFTPAFEDRTVITRLVVADERAAVFLDASSLSSPLELRATLLNDNAGLKDRDLETDRSGRGSGVGGRRHGVGGERSTRRHLLELFARHVATQVDEARKRREFDKLVLVAGPRLLGLLREGLPVPSRALVVAEIDKELAHHDMQAIRNAVPRAAFATGVTARRGE